MAEEKMMRLMQVTRLLGVGSQTIIEKLATKGYKIDASPNTKINTEQLNVLAKEFGVPSLVEDSAAKKTVEEPKAPINNDILYFREDKTPKVVEKEEVKAVEPEKVKIESTLGGLKVLGKIDLNAPRKVETPQKETPPAVEIKETPAPIIKEIVAEPVVTPPTPVVVAPKVEVEQPKIEVQKPKEEPKPVPVVEEKPIVVEVQQPVIVVPPKVEIPPVQKVAEKPIEKYTPKVEVPTKEPAPQVVAKEPAVVEPSTEPQLIEARGERLQGLKILGKIELPVEKKPVASSDDRKKKRKRKRVPGKPEVGGTTTGGNTNTAGNGPRVPYAGNNPRPNTNTTGTGPRPPYAGNNPRPNTNTTGTNTGTNTTNTSTNTNNTNNNNASSNNANKDKKKKGGRKEEVSQGQVKDQIKQTMVRMQTKGADFGAKFRKEKRRSRAEQEEQRLATEEEGSSILKVTEFISASELASMMDVSINELISACMKMGMFVSINQRLDAEQIQMITLEFGFDVEFVSAEEEVKADIVEIIDTEEELQPRAPIVTIMGHVDHGKTSLLDYIRRTKVASGEAGGITQHIGAYSVKMQGGTNAGKQITFLDTPGHEAFTAMRARGAKVTDVVIVVISADDSVMPQTREAINHAQNAGVPIVFALNKIDKAGANPQKIREDLAKENILVESWGGKYQEQEISAKQGIGIDELLDKVLLEAEMLELRANPNRKAQGTVVEAMLDKGRGYVTTILVETGKLKVGDVMLAGPYFGRVKAMMNDKGERIQEAGPSSPVQLLGLPGAPQAGDKFNIMDNEREAREIANKREQLLREQSTRTKKHITLDEIGRRRAIGAFHELNVIVKGDVDGSVEALSDSLLKLSTEEVQVRIIHKAVGQISESDITLASAADAVVVAFQVRPSPNARKLAEQEQIEIRQYSIIYDAINDVKEAMTGLLAPKVEEIIVGTVEVREVFKISKIGTIAGCYVTDGSIKRNNKVRLIREGIVIHEGDISQLKRFKDDVNEVKYGFEFGLSIKGLNDIEIGDTVESYELKEVKRTL